MTRDASDADNAAARRSLGAAFRRLGNSIAGHHGDTASLTRLAADLAEHADDLDRGEPRVRADERSTGEWGPPPADGEEMFSFDDRPISGRSSPFGLDLTIVRDGDEAVGQVRLGAAHEGAPGRSHGGIVSALFDDLFGFVLTLEQQAGFTGTLNVRYEIGVPIHRPLECRVRLDRRDGRKLLMSGELTSRTDDGDPIVHTRSTATFIAVDESVFGISARP